MNRAEELPRFESLVDYLRHLVDDHGIAETQRLWASGRDRFDALHADAHAPSFEDGWKAACRAAEAAVRHLHDTADGLFEPPAYFHGLMDAADAVAGLETNSPTGLQVGPEGATSGSA